MMRKVLKMKIRFFDETKMKMQMRRGNEFFFRLKKVQNGS